MFHKEILNENQIELLPLIGEFKREYYRIPDLLDLAAMKAYALGRRSKWKDYVDLYFLLNDKFTLGEISNRATEIYGDLFSDKLFRSQLSYFEDVDYSEEVDYLIPTPPTEEEIKNRLIAISTTIEL